MEISQHLSLFILSLLAVEVRYSITYDAAQRSATLLAMEIRLLIITLVYHYLFIYLFLSLFFVFQFSFFFFFFVFPYFFSRLIILSLFIIYN